MPFAPGLTAGVETGLVAVLQAYLCPYQGTFQLARQVDRFVSFDGVSFVEKGYTDRNAVRLDRAARRCRWCGMCCSIPTSTWHA